MNIEEKNPNAWLGIGSTKTVGGEFNYVVSLEARALSGGLGLHAQATNAVVSKRPAGLGLHNAIPEDVWQNRPC